MWQRLKRHRGHRAVIQRAFASAMVGVVLIAAGCSTPQPIASLDNLRRAYRGTMYQYEAYLADAGLADAQGYHGSADLFRNLAKQELARAHEQARLMKKIQGES